MVGSHNVRSPHNERSSGRSITSWQAMCDPLKIRACHYVLYFGTDISWPKERVPRPYTLSNARTVEGRTMIIHL